METQKTDIEAMARNARTPTSEAAAQCRIDVITLIGVVQKQRRFIKRLVDGEPMYRVIGEACALLDRCR